MSSNNEHRPGNDLSGYIWDGQYDGEEHEENVAQQAAAELVLNPSSMPSTTSIPTRNKETFDRLDQSRDESGNQHE